MFSVFKSVFFFDLHGLLMKFTDEKKIHTTVRDLNDRFPLLNMVSNLSHLGISFVLFSW